MPGTLNRFRIEALHNRFTIDVEIKDNRLVLVGENGTGKSTVANFIYLFLTQQWARMLGHYTFGSITATIDTQSITFTKEELSHFKISDRFMRRLGPISRQRLSNLLREVPLGTLLANPTSVTSISSQYHIEPRIVRDYIDAALEEATPLYPEGIDKTTSILKSFTEKVLYLPTYRRIEQDLAEIFPGSEQSIEFKKTVEHLRRREHNSGHLELVEFGMQDVEYTISQKLRSLKDSLGADLSELTSTYLRDVILGVYQSAELSEVSKLDEATLDTVFSRLDKAVLPEREQKLLRQTIEEIKTSQDLQDKDKVVVHFLSKLTALHKKQQDRERNMQEFVNVCNQYLTGKEFIYDNVNFKTSIQLQKPISLTQVLDQEEFRTSDLLEMSNLSSGEKQIVSLFAQIYLSEFSNYFVIIDEPELSLSVPWQKRFLPDILNTGRCDGLIAVTHSPFIFDNELDVYARSLESFVEP